MTIRLSHRWRIALTTTLAAACLFLILFLGAFTLIARTERRAAEDLLDAPMSEVQNSLRSGEPLDEEVGSQDRVTIVVFNANGRERFRSGRAPVQPWQGKGELMNLGRDLVFRSETFKGEKIVAVSDWTGPKRRLGELRLVFLILLLPLSACVGLTAFIAAGLMYRPLRRLTSNAKNIAADGRISLLEDPNDPDFSPLVYELNSLLSRIETEVKRQERLVSDVAHDLRTPLTVIRGRLETALLTGQTSNYPTAMTTAIKEAERLSAMADAILSAQVKGPQAEPIELSEPLVEAVDRWKPIFEQRGSQVSIQATKVWATIRPEEWISVIDNLLDNAFKYGGDQCTIRLIDDDGAVLEVSDNGKGVPEVEQEHIFERFFRLDASRSSDGHGLGLYLCRTILGSRGGTITLQPSPLGARFEVRLPQQIEN